MNNVNEFFGPIQKGDIYFVRSDDMKMSTGHEMWSDRYGVVVSNDTTNKMGSCVQVVYLSTSFHLKPSPTCVAVLCNGRPVKALCSQIHTVDTSRLSIKQGSVSKQELKEMDKAILLQLGIHQVNYRNLFKKWEHYIQEFHIPVCNEVESLNNSMSDKKMIYLQNQLEIALHEIKGYKTLIQASEARLASLQEKEA